MGLLPVFASDSLLDRNALTISPAAASGFPKERLFDDRTFVSFKFSATGTLDIKTDAGVGNTEDVDYFGLIEHDLFTQGSTIVFASSPDDAVYTTIFTVVPADNLVIFRVFTKVTERFFRLRITGSTAAPSIGELQWGTRVEAPFHRDPSRGFDPLEEGINNGFERSQTGNIVGSVHRHVTRRADLRFRNLPFTFINGITIGLFREFYDNRASLGFPFFFSWNPDDPGSFEKDTFWAVLDTRAGVRRPLSTQLDTGFRDLQLTVVGQKEG